MEICKLCSEQFETLNNFINHLFHSHDKMKMKEYVLQTKHEGKIPLCSCGCGSETRYEPNKKDFNKWISGHMSRVSGHWGDLKSEKRVKAISEARKQRFASGEYDYIKEAVRNRNPEELGKKISEGAKGVPKPKPEGFGVGRIQSAETREKMSQSHKHNWETGNIGDKKHYTSKLEIKFEIFLTDLGINYNKHFFATSIKSFFDFYLPEYNTLVEVDGDFWHSNPTKYPEPVYESQKYNRERDIIKSDWATQNGYKLIRFWESEINDNPELVIKKLQKFLES